MSTASAAPATAKAAEATPPWLGEFVLLAAVWGASFLFMRVLGAEVGAIPTAGARVALAALCLLPLMWLRKLWAVSRQHWRGMLVVGLLNSALPFALYAWAVQSINTGLAAILNASSPLFGALVARWWLGERLTATRIAGLALGMAGVVALAGGQAEFKPGGTGWAVLACLLASLSYGVAACYTRQKLSGVPPLAIATSSQIAAALLLAVPTAALWPAHPLSAHAWGALVGAAVLCTALAYILYFRLIARAGPARAIAVTFLSPVFAVGYGALLLSEPITPRMLLCGAVIVLGTALATGLLKPRTRVADGGAPR